MRKKLKILIPSILFAAILLVSGFYFLYIQGNGQGDQGVKNTNHSLENKESRVTEVKQEPVEQVSGAQSSTEHNPTQPREMPSKQQIPDNIPTGAPVDIQEFKGIPKVDIKKISESKLIKLGFTKIQTGDVSLYEGIVDNLHIAITFREGHAHYVGVVPYPEGEVPVGVTYIQYSDIYGNNEIAVSDGPVINKLPDYENIRRVVFNPDGSFQYATKNPDQSVLTYYDRICEIIKQLMN